VVFLNVFSSRILSFLGLSSQVDMMNWMFQLVLFADGVWGTRTLESLLQSPLLEVQAVVLRKNPSDDSLEELAKRENLTILQPEKVNSPSCRKVLLEFDSQLFVSMSYDQIFKKQTYSIATLGAINCHAGKLPWYRGRSILNWVLIEGESEFGITVHQIDETIDTGGIIKQEVFPISDEDDYATLMETALKECPRLLAQAVEEIAISGQIKLQSQTEIDPTGSYYPRRKSGDERVVWDWGARKIFNFVRALVPPGPMAQSQTRRGEVHSFLKVLPCDKSGNFLQSSEEIGQLFSSSEVKPGIFKRIDNHKVAVICREGVVILRTKDPVNEEFGCYVSEQQGQSDDRLN